MKNIKRFICLPVAAVMLLSLNLTSCGKSDAETKTGDTETVTETAETTAQHFTADVPDADFEGAEFRQLGIDPNTYDLCLDFEVEQQNGEVLNDSIYNRNALIEDKYNVTFKSTYLDAYDKTTAALKEAVLAGSDDYELVMLINRDAFSSAQNGYLTNISKIPYINIDQPWYIKGINSQFSIKNKLYFAYTDECVNLYLQNVMICFNKQMVEDLSLDDPYKLVTDGNWTLDTFETMAKAAIKDVNGDGKYDQNDIFGIDSESDMMFPSFWISSDTRTVQKDASDVPAFTLPSDEKLLGILERISGWTQIDGFYYDNFEEIKYDEQSRVEGSKLFAGGLSLFRVGVLSTVFTLRNMDSDFGLLPLPKYDEAQQSYVGRMIDGWINVVPATNTKLEMTGTILENLGAESKNTVIPALYDIALKTKYSRDEESSAMLDIIFENVTVDLGDTVWQSDIRGTLSNMCLNGKTGFASQAEKMVKKSDSIITKAIEAIDKVG
jgi:hypothetical protein